MAKKSEWDDMKISGWLGRIHKLAMFITFPIRRFWLFLLLVLVVVVALITVPVSKGVRVAEVWDWYKVRMPNHEFVAVKQKAAFEVKEKITELKNSIGENLPTKSVKDKTKTEKKKTNFVTWNIAEFKQAEYKPKPKITMNVRNTSKSDSTNNSDLEKFYYKMKNLRLTYLKNAETRYGKADVLGPNSLYINDTFIYLYGVYTDEKKYDLDAAENYLRKMVENKNVRCEIVAYTQSGAGTGLCFVDNILLNRDMVENDLADNVALR